ncbi:MAG: glycine cleavage system protein H [Candidatus Abyssobacteria bacterium SURF_17]|jgi:glycine cleavage system H lipoate-binding protein|uniref:Glycine cleavage system protein H n=1 Tax=Candidatus Abyssobacteria bacterium SURF_17 TaxID=2093361 RepID=A0A419EPK3_9BACT|nr:MAG: glycine cleavage system protein H [Candidatus Abyssubacteria bacterium SURF_17]
MVPVTIVGLILAFLAVDVFVQMFERSRGKEVYGFFMPDPAAGNREGLPILSRVMGRLRDFGIAPLRNAYFHPGHTWAAVSESGDARIGLDAFAQKVIGRVEAIELPKAGQTIRQGQPFFRVRKGNRMADFVAPIDGVVTSVNEAAASRNELSPSEHLCTVEPSRLSENLKVLRIAEDAARWMYDELFDLHEMVAARLPRLQTVGATMQDGALALDDLQGNLDDEAWNEFRKRFLMNAED